MSSSSKSKRPRSTRVIIVDDHDMVREGLAIFLKAFQDMQLVGEASSGEEAVRLAAGVSPDIVLMDLVMPGLGGVEAIRQIHEKHPQIKIIALSSFEQEQLIKSAMRAGATSYLLKNIAAERLAEAIRSSLSGLPTFAPEIAPSLFGEPSPSLHENDYRLTPREREVLMLLADGLSNKEISKNLSISLNTAKNYVANILFKLGVSNRTQAARVVSHEIPAGP